MAKFISKFLKGRIVVLIFTDLQARHRPFQWQPERAVVVVCRSQKRKTKAARDKALFTQLMDSSQTSFFRRRHVKDTNKKESSFVNSPVEQFPQELAFPQGGINNVWPADNFEKEITTKNSPQHKAESFADPVENCSDHLSQQFFPLSVVPEKPNDLPQSNITSPRAISSDLDLGAEEDCFTWATDPTRQTTGEIDDLATSDFTDLSLGAQEECYAITNMSQSIDSSQTLDKYEPLRDSECSSKDDISTFENIAQSVKQAQNYRKMVEKYPETPDESAQRLFRKRMLVLYHWLQPSVTISQLNLILEKTWRSLPSEEKEYYISQGKHQPINLKTNPQVHSITELPKLQHKMTEDEAAVNSLLDPFSESPRLKADGALEELKPNNTLLPHHSAPRVKKISQRIPAALALANTEMLDSSNKGPNNLYSQLCHEDMMWDLNLVNTQPKSEPDTFWEDIPTMKELFQMSY